MKKPPPFDTLAISRRSRPRPLRILHAGEPGPPAKSVAEFVAYAGQNPDELNYASSNNSEYMADSQFMRATGVRMTRVRYKGAA